MGETQLEMSEPTDRLISSNTKCNSKQFQIVEKANERPEWLPDGWNVDFRIRKSGANMGCGYKCYIDPVNGYKFYSKPEVLRYLETLRGSSCTPKTEEKCNTTHSHNNVGISIKGSSCMTKKEERYNTTHSQSNVAVEKSPVEDLPPGWLKEVKVRKSNKGNKKDVFYTDPASGYVFRSKKDVLRYLESGDISKCASKPNRSQINEDNFTPSSAGKRQKLKQSATKRQLFVGKELSEESSLSLPDANSSKKGRDVKLSSGMMVAPVPTSDSVINMHSLENVAADPPEMEKSADPDDVQKKNYIVDVVENANGKNHSDPRVCNNKELNVAPRFSRRLAGIEDDPLINNKTSEQSVQAPKRNLRKSRTTLDADMANNSSQQLHGSLEDEYSLKMQGEGPNKNKKDSKDLAIFKEQPHQVETENIADNKLEQNPHSLSRVRNSSSTNQKFEMKFIIGAELPSPDTHNGHALASDSLAFKENKLHANEIGKNGLREISTSSSKSRNKKECHIPRRASKRLAGVEPKLVSNSISCEKAPEYKSKKSKGEVINLQQTNDGPTMVLADHSSINRESSDKSRKPPEMTPITNNQLQQLEDEEMHDEKPEPQLSFAFHYSWSDPSLDSAIKTLTGALPVEDSDGKGPIRIPENVMFHKNKLFENGRESSDDKSAKVNSNKSKNKKKPLMPRRLSKRLAGHEPEVISTGRALEYATRKSCKDKPTATATNGTAGHLGSKGETNLILHEPNSLEKGVPAASSSKHEKPYDTLTVPKEQGQKLEAENSDKEGLEPRKSEKPYDVHTTPKEQLQKLEAETVDSERLEPELPLPFGDSWSDPCLEFAIKTLTGALPVDAAADNLPVITADVSDPPNKELLDCVVQESVSKEAHDNSNQLQNKIELNTVCQPSRQLLEQPELRACSVSCKNDPKFANGESCSDEGNIKRKLDGGESLNIEAGNVIQLAHHSIDLNAQIFEGESVPAEQSQLETEAMNQDNSESQFCASFMDSWSDPYLDFAFKTLTGAIPVEENIAIQGSFQEPSNPHAQRDGSSNLPRVGSSSFAQSDLSFHNDIVEKPMSGQQSSMSSTFLPPVQSCLHGSNVGDPQKHCSQCSHDFQRR